MTTSDISNKQTAFTNSNIFKIFLTLVLFGVVLYNTDIYQSLDSLKENISLWDFLFVVIIFSIAVTVNSLKWKILLPSYKFGQLLKLNLIGRYYSLLLPGQIFGEIIKVLIMKKKKNDVENITASIIMDKLTGLMGLFMIGLVGVVFTKKELPPALTWALLGGVVLGVCILFMFQLSPQAKFLNKLLKLSSEKNPIAPTLKKLLQAWYHYSNNKLKLLVCILLGCFYQILGVIIIMIIAQNLKIQLPFTDWCWIVGILNVALFIPLTIAGVGIREFTLIGVLTWLGFQTNDCLALSLADFGLYIIFAISGGILHIITMKNNFTNREVDEN